MSKQVPFHSYGGDEPYLFVSYAHRDEAAVFGVLRALHERRCRVWYDEGIEVGVNWPQAVAERLRDSDTVLVFLSKHALESQNCQREINFSVSQRKKLLVVRLDDCTPPPGLGMQLSVAPTLGYADAETSAAEILALLGERVLGDAEDRGEARSKKRKKPVNGWLAASLALTLVLAATTLYLFGTLNGWFGRSAGIQRQEIETETRGEVTVTDFSSRMTLELLLRAMDGESVYLCGNSLVSDALAIEHTAAGWSVGSRSLERGFLDDLSLFEDSGVTQLALVNENLSSLEGIGALEALSFLDLSDNPVTDLAPLTALTQLRTLRILCLPAETDLSPLAGLPELREVAVSYDMVDRIGPLLDAGIDVIVKR